MNASQRTTITVSVPANLLALLRRWWAIETAMRGKENWGKRDAEEYQAKMRRLFGLDDDAHGIEIREAQQDAASEFVEGVMVELERGGPRACDGRFVCGCLTPNTAPEAGG